MSRIIRTVRVEEFDGFMRFLEKCYGHPKDFFPREYPHMYRPDPTACACLNVVEAGGRIVSHVGVFPIETVTTGVRVLHGGIGGVATLPEERGKGHMTVLLNHAIGLMREKGCLVSCLGGDRQRYNRFGWESAGLTYSLRFSPRSLASAAGKRVEIEQQLPDEAAPVVERFCATAACHARRNDLRRLLRKQNLRFWTGEDGYAIVSCRDFSSLAIVELVSSSGNEAWWIRALLEWSRGHEARICVSAWDADVLTRLMDCATGWSAGPDLDYRVIDLAGLLEAGRPAMEGRAAGLGNFEVSLGIRESDRLDEATLRMENGRIEVVRGGEGSNRVELDPVSAVRLVLGGLPIATGRAVPAPLRAILPVPIHVPAMDHV